MSLKKLIKTLSRSSAQAVSTLGNSDCSVVKEYLYIKTDIEKALHGAIEKTTSGKGIIFLCGSSGDGKSEILTRYYEQYKRQLDFHLDATHSYQPDMTAIETLDRKFDGYESGDKPLVVGINIGMLGNYAEEGANNHPDIKNSVQAFLENEHEKINGNHIFLNFEDYPKFEAVNDDLVSPFIQSLLNKITNPSQDNPFYQAWQKDMSSGDNVLLHTNYRLLQHSEVQQTIIKSLLKVRTKYDQFLTTRTLLDLIYNLLAGPGHLFDNLFTGRSSDLSKALTHFDPCTIRSKRIDLFLIQNSLGILDADFEAFKKNVHELVITEEMEAGSWIRFFYIIQDLQLTTNYHQQFRGDFRSQLYEEYVRIWLLHKKYNGERTEKIELREFYRDCLLKALFRYANRFAPELSRIGHIFLADYNGYKISTISDVKESMKRIEENRPERLGHFNALLKLGDENLPPVPVSASFLDLIMKINNGYRPNKHDKNSIVILEELIEDIRRRVRGTDKLNIHNSSRQWTLTNDTDEEEIIVERF